MDVKPIDLANFFKGPESYSLEHKKREYQGIEYSIPEYGRDQISYRS